MHELFPLQQDLRNLLLVRGVMPLQPLVQHFRNELVQDGLLKSPIPKISRYIGK